MINPRCRKWKRTGEYGPQRGHDGDPCNRSIDGHAGDDAVLAAGGRSWGNGLDADSSLVERCLSGDETAWEDLVKVHTRRVYAICYRFTSSDVEAQDLTQDVFLRVFRSLKSFRAHEGIFVVWLTRLTRNLLIDHYRRTRAERVTDSIEEQLPCSRRKRPCRPGRRFVGRARGE